MVVTILQAEVDPARAPDLVAAYREGIGELEPGIVETYLLHDARDDTQWRIVTLLAKQQPMPFQAFHWKRQRSTSTFCEPFTCMPLP